MRVRDASQCMHAPRAKHGKTRLAMHRVSMRTMQRRVPCGACVAPRERARGS
jgi:hypothetical protein